MISLTKKFMLAARRSLLFAVRPLIGNRKYTQRYIKLLARYGVDIAPFDKCGFIATSVNFDMYDYSRIHIGANVFLTHDVVLLVHDQSLVTAYNAGGGLMKVLFMVRRIYALATTFLLGCEQSLCLVQRSVMT